MLVEMFMNYVVVDMCRISSLCNMYVAKISPIAHIHGNHEIIVHVMFVRKILF